MSYELIQAAEPNTRIVAWSNGRGEYFPKFTLRLDKGGGIGLVRLEDPFYNRSRIELWLYDSEVESLLKGLQELQAMREAQRAADEAEWEARVAERIDYDCQVDPANEAAVNAILQDGRGVAFYTSADWAIKLHGAYPTADLWLTTRQGDEIALLVPKETPREKLPLTAISYLAFSWFTPSEFTARYGVAECNR